MAVATNRITGASKASAAVDDSCARTGVRRHRIVRICRTTRERSPTQVKRSGCEPEPFVRRAVSLVQHACVIAPDVSFCRSTRVLGRSNPLDRFNVAGMLLDEIGVGAPLICMPGGPGFAAGHLGSLGGLDAKRRLVRVNTRGAGGSQPPTAGTYALNDYCEDLDAVVSRLGVDQVDLFGHSHGALVAARYAATRNRVRRLVLDAMPPRRADLPTPNGIEDYFASWNQTAQAYVEQALSDRCVGPYEWFETHEWSALEPDDELRRIHAPVLVVTGSDDWACGASRARRMAELASEGEAIVIEHAGHFAWVEQPTKYAAEVEAFLSR